MWHDALKLVHVLAAITAVGANLTYSIWIQRAQGDPQVLRFVLHSISFIDRRLANPCYAVVLISGLAMALTLRIPVTTPWLLAALVLYALAALLGVLVLAPTARRQRALLESEDFHSPAYGSLAKKSGRLGFLVMLDVLIIAWLMVFKPPLWG
jgi:uncharacterized membrane protein